MIPNERPRPELRFGLAYRSRITLDIEGTNFLATRPTGMSAIGLSGGAVFPFSRARATSTVSSSVTLPDTLDLAVAWLPTDRLALEFDATWTGWSSFDELLIEFDSPQFAAFNGQAEPWDWEDVWAYKLGAQYALSPRIDLRAGYMFDNTPVPDATLDSNNQDQTTLRSANGTYRSTYLLAANITMRF